MLPASYRTPLALRDPRQSYFLWSAVFGGRPVRQLSFHCGNLVLTSSYRTPLAFRDPRESCFLWRAVLGGQPATQLSFQRCAESQELQHRTPLGFNQHWASGWVETGCGNPPFRRSSLRCYMNANATPVSPFIAFQSSSTHSQVCPCFACPHLEHITACFCGVRLDISVLHTHARTHTHTHTHTDAGLIT